MVTLQKTTNEHTQPDTTDAHDNSTQPVAAKIGPFVWRLLAMSLAMGFGMALFYLLVLLIRTSSSYGAMFEAGSDLYAIGMAVFMTVPTWLASHCTSGGRMARSNNC